MNQLLRVQVTPVPSLYLTLWEGLEAWLAGVEYWTHH